MPIDPQLRRDVESAEGCKLVAYRDTKGFWTVGWGHKLPRQDTDWTGYTITQDQADRTLDDDLAAAVAQADRLPEAGGSNRCRLNALSELVFNMGLIKWTGFVKCRAAWRVNNYETAALELANSLWDHEIQASRAQRLIGYVRTGLYPPSVAVNLSSAS